MPEDQLLFTKRTISAIKEEEKKVSPIPSEHIVPIPPSPKVKVADHVLEAERQRKIE